MSTLKTNLIQDLSGNTQYTCKAWVNFNGTGTVAIRASGNVSSITDNGTGNYSINFTNDMVDTSYCVSAVSDIQTSINNNYVGTDSLNSSSSSFARIVSKAGSSPVGFDFATISVAIFR